MRLGYVKAYKRLLIFIFIQRTIQSYLFILSFSSFGITEWGTNAMSWIQHILPRLHLLNYCLNNILITSYKFQIVALSTGSQSYMCLLCCLNFLSDILFSFKLRSMYTWQFTSTNQSKLFNYFPPVFVVSRRIRPSFLYVVFILLSVANLRFTWIIFKSEISLHQFKVLSSSINSQCVFYLILCSVHGEKLL